MPDPTQSYLEGIRSGESLAQNAVGAYDKAKAWRERLKDKADAHDAASAALKTEADRYKDKMDLGSKKLEEDKSEYERSQTETEKHNRAMEKTAKEKADSSSGIGQKYLKSLEFSYGIAAKAVNAIAGMGDKSSPAYLSAKKQLSKAKYDLQKYQESLGLEVTHDDPDAPPPPPPAPGFGSRMASGVANFFSANKPNAEAPKTLRSGTVNGKRVTESYPGEWGP